MEDYSDFEEYLYEKYVTGKLADAEAYAKRPDAVWHNFDDVSQELRQD